MVIIIMARNQKAQENSKYFNPTQQRNEQHV